MGPDPFDGVSFQSAIEFGKKLAEATEHDPRDSSLGAYNFGANDDVAAEMGGLADRLLRMTFEFPAKRGAIFRLAAFAMACGESVHGCVGARRWKDWDLQTMASFMVDCLRLILRLLPEESMQQDERMAFAVHATVCLFSFLETSMRQHASEDELEGLLHLRVCKDLLFALLGSRVFAEEPELALVRNKGTVHVIMAMVCGAKLCWRSGDLANLDPDDPRTRFFLGALGDDFVRGLPKAPACSASSNQGDDGERCLKTYCGVATSWLEQIDCGCGDERRVEEEQERRSREMDDQGFPGQADGHSCVVS